MKSCRFRIASFPSCCAGALSERLREVTKLDETVRLLEFSRLNPVATASEASFDVITRLVQQIFCVPAVAITLIDKDTQYLKARQGIDVARVSRCDAVCDIVVRTGEPLAIGNMLLDRRVSSNPAVVGPLGLRAYAGAPLTTPSGQHLGAICVLDTQPRSFSAAQIELLSSFAMLVSDQLELRAQAEKDFLTNTLNRRGFGIVLKREMAWIHEGGPPATLAMFDLDYFKRVNDTHGHPVGDLVLRSVSVLIASHLRKVDYLARLGGEEFALLLPDTPFASDLRIVDDIRQAVANFRLPEVPGLTLTVSIGAIGITRWDADYDALMSDVDAAIYVAKASGRNQTIAFPKGHPTRTSPYVDLQPLQQRLAGYQN